jgi:hypothetical protein
MEAMPLFLRRDDESLTLGSSSENRKKGVGRRDIRGSYVI